MADDKVDVSGWRPILTIIVFFLTTIIVSFPFSVPLPSSVVSAGHGLLVSCRVLSSPEKARQQRLRVPFNFLSVPLFAVLLLLATSCIDGQVLKRGIVGADGVQPLDILALFISLAYISISLDATGLLRYAAFWVAKKGGASGQRLYFFFYAFFLVCGVIVGNDPVILSGTAFLAYFTRVTGITPPTAWIFAQFSAANMASVVLVSSNPTNLVLSGAFKLTFLSYTSSAILPCIFAALAVYPLLVFLLFRRPRELIPRAIDAGEVGDPRAALVDGAGAIFGGVLLIITLAVLVGTSTVGVPVWEVTVPPALIMLARDIWHDWRSHHTHAVLPSATDSIRDADADTPTTDVPPMSGNTIPLERRTSKRDVSTPAELPAPRATPPPRKTNKSLADVLTPRYTRIKQRFPTVHAVAQRLPVPLIPFALAMFVLVQGLAAQGWVQVFVGWWAAWVRVSGLTGAVFGMSVVSGLLCNVCGTNIGTTILLARMLQIWSETSPAPEPRTRYGSIYALALGSNFGAFSVTFAASLAGLLWRGILAQKGIHVRQRQFALLNIGIWALATAVGAGVLVAQAVVVYR